KLKFAAMNLKKLALHKWRPLSYFYFLLLQEATLLRCKVASLTRWRPPVWHTGVRLDCQKTSWGGLEGRSPPNARRIRRHVRRIRKLAQQGFLALFPARRAPRGREGNSVKLGK